MDKFKTVITQVRNLFEWLIPFNIFLILIFIIKLFFKDININELLKIIIWPVTVLLILFFFRKVVTFLFFSMNEFNFFGAKGNLKDVNEIILEEVEKRFFEEKKEQKNNKIMSELKKEISNKQNELKKANGNESKLKLANEIILKWKKLTEESTVTINDLTKDNKRLRESLSNFSTSPSVSPSSSILIPEIGSGEKTIDFKPGVPIIK